MSWSRQLQRAARLPGGEGPARQLGLQAQRLFAASPAPTDEQNNEKAFGSKKLAPAKDAPASVGCALLVQVPGFPRMHGTDGSSATCSFPLRAYGGYADRPIAGVCSMHEVVCCLRMQGQ